MSSAGAKGVEGPAGPLVNERYVTLLKEDFDNYLKEIECLRHAIIKIRTITNVDWVEDMDKHDTDINDIIKKALGG